MSDFEFHVEDQDGFAVSVSKIGGGTVGRAYEGRWQYLATSLDGSRVILSGSDLWTGSAKTHAEAAEIVAAFATDAVQSAEGVVIDTSRLSADSDDPIVTSGLFRPAGSQPEPVRLYRSPDCRYCRRYKRACGRPH